MPFLTHSKNEGLSLYYEDYGKGQPVILIHGWPLSSKMWEQQVWKIVESGYRCITYDRRGFGISSAPWDGYDYSDLAGDLNEIIEQLKLDDCVLVGFSMGGGEVIRYLTDYGSNRINRIALVSSIIPLVKQMEDNPEGVPASALEEIKESLQQDRVGFLKNFSKGFYNFDENSARNRISAAQLDYDFIIASYASPRATIQTALAWMHTDFRGELSGVDVPALVIHGDGDQTVPIATSARQAAEGISDSNLKVIEGAPHGLHLTHARQLNDLLIGFIEK